MKKFLILALILALSAILPACTDTTDNGSTTPPEQEQELDKETQLVSYAYAQMMQDNHYFVDCTSYMQNSGSELVVTEVRLAYDGANSDTTGMIGEHQYRSLLLDNVLYSFDIANKTYTATSLEGMEDSASETANDYSQMEFALQGRMAIPGLEDVDTAIYPYDEYLVPDTTGTPHGENIVRFFIKNDELYAINISYLGFSNTMVVHAMSDTIPEDMLVLPEGYTQVEALGQEQ